MANSLSRRHLAHFPTLGAADPVPLHAKPPENPRTTALIILYSHGPVTLTWGMTLRTSRAATNTIAKPWVLSSPLDADEGRSLKRCERVIARGAKAFIAVGLALSEIKERRLYREEFPTFEAYCQARLNCSRSLGYRLITHAAMVIEMAVSPIGDKLGTESQARELARVPREMRKEVLRLADEMAEGGPLTARLIRQAAIELGVDGNPLLPNGGNDDVQTPAELAKAIVAHFLPSGRVLEPCRGGGAFVKAIPAGDWCDLAVGRDFLAATGPWDWIVSTPPVFAVLAVSLARIFHTPSVAQAWKPALPVRRRSQACNS